jgi:hypothetical protein
MRNSLFNAEDDPAYCKGTILLKEAPRLETRVSSHFCSLPPLIEQGMIDIA